jgi:hypothetical protein
MKEFDIKIASVPYRERLVVEIYYDKNHWAEISQEEEGGEVIIQFYPHPHEEYWEFPLDKALRILEEAKSELLEDYPGS